MSVIVLDASSALEMVRQEPAGDAVRLLLRSEPRTVLVPWIFWLDVVDVLTRRRGWQSDAVLRAVYDLEQLGVSEVAADRVALLTVIDLVGRHGLSAYDASYLAVAMSANAALLTADRRLAQAAGDRAIFVGSQKLLSERPAVYGPTTWARWPGAAAYLQELRAEVLAQRRG